jgi:L-alanine-DL-glutamate epimerase-like enolase superfamily enzyme
MALWDALARVYSLPLVRLLGGAEKTISLYSRACSKNEKIHSRPFKSLKLRVVRVPMTEPHRTASGVVSESPLVLTDVITDTGISGHSILSSSASVPNVEHELIVDLAGPQLMPSGAVSDLEVLDPAKVRQNRFG